MNEADAPHDQLELDRRKRLSSVWIVPLIALVFGGYLAVKAYLERGVFITVHFDTADGMVAGKTEVRYKGLPAGVVKKIQLNEDLQSVIADIEMVKRTEPLLTEESVFWLVQPEVSLSGISGLETIAGGNYVGFRPGKTQDAPPRRNFTALRSPPPIPESTPGLHLVLRADSKGSVQAGTKVYYRQIAVGEVTSVGLDQLRNGVTFKVYIPQEHASLVTDQSRFWNASGITFSGDLSGIKLRTESLESMLVGGIAFDNIDQSQAASGGTTKTQYLLYEDFDAAQVGLPITLNFPFGSGIAVGTEIMLEGLRAGKVLNFSIDEQAQQIVANATIDPRAEKFLNDDTLFYMVAPKASFAGIANLDTLIKGRYIGIRPALAGETTREFDVLPEAPPLGYEQPGLHINLTSAKAPGLSQGDPITFQKITVGSIQQVKYSDNEEVAIAAHIQPEYAHLVKSNTRFWSAGGIRFKGGFQRFQIEADSLVSMISGGITFGQPGGPEQAVESVSNGAEFQLYLDRDDALFIHYVQITFPTAKGIIPEITPVNYNGVTVGKVKALAVDPQLQQVTARVGFNPKFNWSLKEKTQFWLVSPALSEQGLNAIISGSYITMLPGSGKAAKSFQAGLTAPITDPAEEGLQFIVQSETAGSLERGSGIYYQQLEVGEIEDVRLNRVEGRVDIYAHVHAKYADLVKQDSRFFQVSGLTVQGDLSGITFRSGSLASLINGGIAFYTPTEATQGAPAQDRAVYPLYRSLEAAQAVGVDIQIRFNSARGLRIGMPLKFQDQKIGETTGIEFSDDLQTVTLLAKLNRNALRYARADSKFWLVEPQLGLSKVRNVATIVTGTYLELSAGHGAPTLEFTGLEQPPVVRQLNRGLNLVLSSSRPGSVKVGDNVSYRQLKVGSIIGMDLAPDANGVLIYINIFPRYQSLVRNDSVFWNASGLQVDAGLFTGVQIDSESIESLLSGGIAFATPGASRSQKQASNGDQFALFEELDEEWLVWRPDINLSGH